MRRCWPADRRRTGSAASRPVEAEAFHGRVDLGGCRPDRGAPEADVLGDREVEVEAVAVTEQADAPAHLAAFGRQVAAEHGAGATGEREQPGAHPQQRRLAGAVRPAEQHDLAAADGQRHAGERREAAEHGDRTVEVDDRSCHPSPGDAIRSRSLATASAAHPPVPSAGRRVRTEPPPHDWRWVVGTIGKVLIATGLLMFGFVGYQLWGTGHRVRQGAGPPRRRVRRAPRVRLDDDDDAADDRSRRRRRPSRAADDATTTTAPLPAPAVPDFAAGDVMARIEIPAIGLDAKVVSGVQPEDLKQGPGHYPDTPMPGQFGNSAIAGHRTTYGQPFYRLDEVAARRRDRR